jgi:hypothetical protein
VARAAPHVHATIAQTMAHAHLGEDFMASEVDKLGF